MATLQETRAGYRHFLAIPTRWMDNDAYGHVNNAVYYAYFDTVINDFLIRVGELGSDGPVVAYCVESTCRYHRSVGFPETLDAGLRVAHLGNSSVRYDVGLFKADEDKPAAQGHFVRVFVDRAKGKPTTIPENIRACLRGLQA